MHAVQSVSAISVCDKLCVGRTLRVHACSASVRLVYMIESATHDMSLSKPKSC